MTPTQIARRSDALYADGTCGMTRRVLCDMVAQRESDLEDARAENTKLRKEIEAAKHDLSLFSGELVASKAENAKLRELLEAVLQCAGETKRDKGCDACPMYNGPWSNDGTWCLLRPTLRELGIEVNDGTE